MKKLFEDQFLVVFDKPAGMPVQADKTGDRSLLSFAEQQCRRKMHLVHRMDRPVSGAILLAKTKAAMTALTDLFRHRAIEKEYLALVQAMPPAPEDHLVHFLKKNEAKNTAQVVEEDTPGAERAELRYRLVASSDRYHLLHVVLLTGRHHQIRAQLAAIGCPLRGDVKYGFRRANPDRSIGLHAWRIAFEHPFSGERISIVSPLPPDVVFQSMQEAVAKMG
jgi:23S rRNA pseudouridine1911/1915/1917 synthase